MTNALLLIVVILYRRQIFIRWRIFLIEHSLLIFLTIDMYIQISTIPHFKIFFGDLCLARFASLYGNRLMHHSRQVGQSDNEGVPLLYREGLSPTAVPDSVLPDPLMKLHVLSVDPSHTHTGLLSEMK